MTPDRNKGQAMAALAAATSHLNFARTYLDTNIASSHQEAERRSEEILRDAQTSYTDEAERVSAHRSTVISIANSMAPFASCSSDELYNSAQIDSNPDIPSAIRAGSIIHKSVDKNTPLMIPTPFDQNIDFVGNLQHHQGIIESLILRSLVAFPQTDVVVIDPIEYAAALARIGDLTERALTETQIHDALDRVSRRISTVTTQIIKGQYENLEDYNETVSRKETETVVIVLNADHLSKKAAHELRKIISAGHHAGVHVLYHQADLTQREGWKWMFMAVGDLTALYCPSPEGHVGERLPLPFQPDAPLYDDDCSALVTLIRARRAEGNSVSIGLLEEILSDIKMWSTRPGKEITATIGLEGKSKFDLSFGVSGGDPHALAVGAPGSGKSQFLHAVVTSLAYRYSPEDLEMYLLDGKQGVEFQQYAQSPDNKGLPHARVVAVESEIEMQLSVLDKIQDEMNTRYSTFKDHDVSDIIGLERLSAEGRAPRFPRIVVIMDEFQVLFEDEKRAGQATQHLAALGKQGRAAGIHMLLATQTLANLGAGGANKSVFAQFMTRIALRCDPDSSLAAVGSPAASRLQRPGEAVVRFGGGDIRFINIGMDSSEQRSSFLDHAIGMAASSNIGVPEGERFAFPGARKAVYEFYGRPHVLKKPSETPTVTVGLPMTVSGPIDLALRSRPGENIAVSSRDQQLVRRILWAGAASWPGNVVVLEETFDESTTERLRHQALSTSLEFMRRPSDRKLEVSVESISALAAADQAPTLFIGLFDFDDDGSLVTVLEEGFRRNIHVMAGFETLHEGYRASAAAGATIGKARTGFAESFTKLIVNGANRDDLIDLKVPLFIDPGQGKATLWIPGDRNYPRPATILPFV